MLEPTLLAWKPWPRLTACAGGRVARSFLSVRRHVGRARSPRGRELMPAVKLMVLYPPPKDVQAFERVYLDEHVPMVVKKLAGKTKLVATKVQSSPQGKPAFHRIAEVHFPSLEALQACAESAGGKETLAHAAKISTGGPPVVLIAEEQTLTF